MSGLRWKQTFSAAALVWIALGTGLAVAQPNAREPVDEAFGEQLRQLAATCDKLELNEQAEVTRRWQFPRDPRRQYLFLPNSPFAHQPDDKAPRVVKQWHAKFLQIRKGHAGELFRLAKEAAERGDSGAAYRLLHEVLHEDPDHAEARRILGYRQVNGDWRLPARKPQVRLGTNDHAELGWRRRRYWTVNGEHFRIETNHSGRAGLELAEQLEQLHAVWSQLFFEYWGESRQLATLFSNERTVAPRRRQFQVILFRNRQEYAEAFSANRRAASSVGAYVDHRKTSFFFAGSGARKTTWFHEATHQLFQEMVDAEVGPGKENNFWLVEAAALYMESLRLHEGYATVGGFDADQLQLARYRATSENFYRPWNQMAPLGRDAIQGDAEVRRLYSQFAGWMHFLMDGKNHAARRAVIPMLKNLYLGKTSPEQLADLSGESFAELDAEYQRFLLDVSDRDLQFLAADVRRLCLGRTAVSAEALRQIAKCSKLELLDLSFTAADDSVVRGISASGLVQLYLESTQITDQCLDALPDARLEELDLTSTAISDAGLDEIGKRDTLTWLWLTKTTVSDQGLPKLKGLKSLEHLDLRGTRVTPAAQKQLAEALPKWNPE